MRAPQKTQPGAGWFEAVARLVKAGFGTADEVLDMPYPQFKGYSAALASLDNQALAKLMGVITVSREGGEPYMQLYNALTGNS